MGFLLKEALKALCDSNHWCYAVFWKIGHQNPKLLIWEECHYELTQCAVLPPFPGNDSSEILLEGTEQRWVSAKTQASQIGSQAGNSISLLVNKMMISNPVSVVGEGLVGRAAFTGNQLWILSRNYNRDAHPPEVLNEVHQQFSAGMQTVAVIPVLPHGVVQMGSSLPIMENFGFVIEVRRLILQLGCIPGVLFTTNDSSSKNGVSSSVGASVSLCPSRDSDAAISNPFILDSFNQLNNSLLDSRPTGQFLASLITQNRGSQNTYSLDQTPNLGQASAESNDNKPPSKIPPATNPNHFFGSQLRNGHMNSEVITKNSDIWLDKQVPVNNLGSKISNQGGVAQSNANDSIQKFMEPQLSLDDDLQHHFTSLSALNNPISSYLSEGVGRNHNSYRGPASNQLHGSGTKSHRGAEEHGSADPVCMHTNLAVDEMQNVKSVRTDVVTVSTTGKNSTACQLPWGGYGHIQSMDEMANHIDMSSRKKLIENDLFQALTIPSSHQDQSKSWIEHFPGASDSQKHNKESECPRPKNDFYRDAPSTGEDLFDILGLDLKDELLKSAWNSSPENEAQEKRESRGTSMSRNVKEEGSGAVVVNPGICQTEIFSGTGSDHLLEAVVSSVHSAAKQTSDDNISCRTSLTNISSSSVPSNPSIYNNTIIRNKMQGGLFGLQGNMQKSGTMGSSSCISDYPKNGAGNYSQTSSIYGSQISSWVDQGHNLRRDSSVSTGYSKKPEEIGKSNRKRLKPGESPRPRPKDRQMIQDRVKELREIVPNGAKCSIDSLLERTIKHMLFLQSVTKHADKLQQTEESKITSKEGGVLLKDNFDGGATWAFEVGSQSMVCPIKVEDLNLPRQMLVEMLCEERGFFLEIADIIRGMGLTILKGVMEVRSGKIWARFAVEANRDITRMDIFISLVGLLDQAAQSRTAAAPALGVEKDMMAMHHCFPQAASIPATGRPSSFQ